MYLAALQQSMVTKSSSRKSIRSCTFPSSFTTIAIAHQTAQQTAAYSAKYQEPSPATTSHITIMDVLNQGPVRITADPPQVVARNTPMSPAITASFTPAEYTGGVAINDYTKLMATIILYHSSSTEIPVAGLKGAVNASPNEWTTVEVVHFTFAHASVEYAGEYYLQVTVSYLTDAGYYEILASAWTTGFWVT